MADSYRKNYKKNISRKDISGNSSKRDIKQRNQYENKRKRPNREYTESRTPPLPTMEDFSIEELLKKKKSIQENLEKIKDFTTNKPNKILKKERKRRYTNIDRKYEDSSSSKIATKKLKQTSPRSNQDYMHNIDSEDEEYIIEQRRKQRKQLYEQLTGAKDNNASINDYKTSTKFVKNSHIANESNEVKNITATKQSCTKEDITDMFSEMDVFIKDKGPESVVQDNLESNSKLADNWDDPEGYYNVRIGDCINKNRYTIKSILGQGVFANVVRAQDNSNKSQDVAIKIIRNNELMQRTGLKEISILKQIDENDPDNKYHCIKLLCQFVHKGHLCIVLEPFYMDMRSILKKYGKCNGINLKALMSYSRQLLLALKLLVKIGVIHADIKPDNILVNENKNILKLCDFGSAAKIHENEPTPYLVSRFYRAPEIILGISYGHGVDIWSTACTIYEMATNTILFTGGSNNKMLKCFMDLKGKIPSKLIKRGKFKNQHFNYNNNFLLHKKDKITEREKVVEISNLNISRDLLHDLKKYFKKLLPSEEKKLLQLKDFLDKMLMLDEKQRLTVADCLKHSFIQAQLQ